MWSGLEPAMSNSSWLSARVKTTGFRSDNGIPAVWALSAIDRSNTLLVGATPWGNGVTLNGDTLRNVSSPVVLTDPGAISTRTTPRGDTKCAPSPGATANANPCVVADGSWAFEIGPEFISQIPATASMAADAANRTAEVESRLELFGNNKHLRAWSAEEHP